MRPTLLTFLGVCFALIGGFTIFSIALELAVVHHANPLSFGYAGLDLLLAFAFLRTQRWLLWALIANWAATTALVSLVALHAGYSPATAVAFLINGGLVAVAVYYRARLKGRNWYAAAAFLGVWLLTMGYTINNFL